MSKKADEMVEKLKKEVDWQDIYDADNMRIAKGSTFNDRKNWYIYQWVEKNMPQSGVILDAGCHDGALLSVLQNNQRKLVGIDISPKVIEFAKENNPTVKFIPTNITDIPFKNEEIDGISCTQIIEHLEQPEEALKELYRILKVGGMMIVSTPIEKMLPDKLHLAEFDLYKVMDMFEKLDRNFKLAYINKFVKDCEFKDKNVFIVKLIKTGEKDGRPDRRL